MDEPTISELQERIRYLEHRPAPDQIKQALETASVTFLVNDKAAFITGFKAGVAAMCRMLPGRCFCGSHVSILHDQKPVDDRHFKYVAQRISADREG
jgi:hypothetical protein